MANGYYSAKFEQDGSATYVPSPGTEGAVAPYFGAVRYFPVQQVKPSLGPNPMERDDELRNADQALLEITDTFDPTFDYTSRAYPDIVGYHLAQVFGRDTSTNYAVAAGSAATALDGTTALASGQYSHTWTAPFGPAGSIPQTSQMIWAYKDQSTYYQMRGAATESLELSTPDAGGVQIKAQGPGLYLSSTANPSLTPSYETPSIRPFVHANLAVTYSGASAPTTAGTASGFDVSIRNPVVAVRTLGASSQYPDRMEKDEGPIMITGTIAKRNLTADDWTAMRDLNLFTITAKWESSQYMTGSSGSKYGLSMTLQAQLVGGDIDDLDNKRRHGSTFNWKAVYDGTTSSAVIKLVNKTASYAA